MTFLRITQPHPYLSRIQHWYEEAFPPVERRRFDQLTTLLSRPDMHLCALIDHDRLGGFIVYWQWADVDTLFVEHLAIDPDQRGRQLGQQAMTYVQATTTTHILLEVERPADEISRRRIQFYERQGFVLTPFEYVQPPYQLGQPAVPMRLMSVPALASLEDFGRFSQLIRERVYERFYT